MYTHFGQKWVRLHHGPMWCTVPTTQEEASHSVNHSQKTMEIICVLYVLYLL